jgi:hypothetical protein
LVVAAFVDPIVTQPPKGQLVHFPSIGTLGDFGDDSFGITKYKNDIWKNTHMVWIRCGHRINPLKELWSPATFEYTGHWLK